MRTEQTVELAPLDVETVLNGEAYVLVSVPNGRRVLGKVVERDSMFVPVGEPMPVPGNRDLVRRR